MALDVLCLAVGEGSVPAAGGSGASPRPAGALGGAAPWAGARSAGGTVGLRSRRPSGPWPVPPGRGQRGRHLPGRCAGLRASSESRWRRGRAGAGSCLSPTGLRREFHFSGPFPFPGKVPRGGRSTVYPWPGPCGRVPRLGRHRDSSSAAAALAACPPPSPALRGRTERGRGLRSSGPVGSEHPF